MLNFIQLELEVRPSSHQNLKELRKRTKRTLQVFFLACSGTSMASRICMFRNLCRCSKGSMCSTMVRVQTSPTFRTISGLQDVWQTWHFENTNADKSSAHHRLCNIFWLNKTLEIEKISIKIENNSSKPFQPNFKIWVFLPINVFIVHPTKPQSGSSKLTRLCRSWKVLEMSVFGPELMENPQKWAFSRENHVAKSSKYWENFQQTMFDYQRVDGRRVSLKQFFW